MLAVTAIIRPEKIIDVQDALYSKGFCAMTKTNVSGRGKERGIKVGDVLYQEMTKIMIYMVVEDDEKEESGCGIEEMDESYIGVYCKENLHMI